MADNAYIPKFSDVAIIEFADGYKVPAFFCADCDPYNTGEIIAETLEVETGKLTSFRRNKHRDPDNFPKIKCFRKIDQMDPNMWMRFVEMFRFSVAIDQIRKECIGSFPRSSDNRAS